jgi:type III pantothenate kinase
MILEMDCGNSLIKWRVLCEKTCASMGGGAVDTPDRLLEELHAMESLQLSFCRFVSVRSDEETQQLSMSIGNDFGIPVAVAKPSTSLAGVTNGYDDYQRLGLDRWMAIVAAYSLSKRACIVLDLGTAVTCDLVSREGRHLGGYICPGVPLMRDQLRTHTRKIRYDMASAEKALTLLEPGRSTVEAVERGCALMMRSFVATQVAMAAEFIGKEMDVFLTGGDAVLASEAISNAHIVPDLVFQGLAIACPQPERS